MPFFAAQKAALERRVHLRELVFGVQDDLLSTVGLLSGVFAATDDVRVIVSAGFAAGVTGRLSIATARTSRRVPRRFRSKNSSRSGARFPMIHDGYLY
jgi:VIT1/CCC1 family predicted Fe2+/Mn2+ transporter